MQFTFFLVGKLLQFDLPLCQTFFILIISTALSVVFEFMAEMQLLLILTISSSADSQRLSAEPAVQMFLATLYSMTPLEQFLFTIASKKDFAI